jgi:hypothetical protein
MCGGRPAARHAPAHRPAPTLSRSRVRYACASARGLPRVPIFTVLVCAATAYTLALCRPGRTTRTRCWARHLRRATRGARQTAASGGCSSIGVSNAVLRQPRTCLAPKPGRSWLGCVAGTRPSSRGCSSKVGRVWRACNAGQVRRGGIAAIEVAFHAGASTLLRRKISPAKRVTVTGQTCCVRCKEASWDGSVRATAVHGCI